MVDVRVYERSDGHCPFSRWFDDLDGQVAAKVTVAVERLRRGNTSNVKGLGQGVQELKIDWGPGYRIYFGRDGDRIVILLAGGTKQRQNRDIAGAKDSWADYKLRSHG